MKKLMTLMLGLTLVFGSAAFAQDKDQTKTDSTEKKAKKKSKKDKKEQTPKS